MAIVAFSELEPEILAVAPACPTPTVTRALRTAARNLAERTNAFQVTLDNVVVPRYSKSISLDVPTQTVLHKPVSLRLNGKPIEPGSPALMDESDPDWRDSYDTPYMYWMATDELDAIVLAPYPNSTLTNGIKGQIAVKPSRTATGIDEVWMDRYQDAIVDGALGDLLMVRSAPWYDPQLGAVHKGFFESAMLDAKAYGDGDNMYKRRTVRYGGL